MSGTAHQVRKRIVKSELKKGRPYKHAALKAGYAPATAHNATQLAVVKECRDELITEFTEKDVTVLYVINNLREDRRLAQKKKDMATMTRCDELLGKYLAMFTDRQRVETDQKPALVINTVNAQDKLAKGLDNQYIVPGRDQARPEDNTTGSGVKLKDCFTSKSK